MTAIPDSAWTAALVAAELALTVISALQGGLLMAQATRSARPLELALNMASQHMAGYRPRPKQAK